MPLFHYFALWKSILPIDVPLIVKIETTFAARYSFFSINDQQWKLSRQQLYLFLNVPKFKRRLQNELQNAFEKTKVSFGSSVIFG